ncbi:MAG TPA: SAM-dependent methyltransferase, partial [Candidatus Saccharimonadia bacterium]|nr:SAM-dependent methyltransferase [Candidatus Saccharimonadia bacterium]
AIESERPDALFRDHLAKVLSATRGHEIASIIGRTSRYSAWSVVIRTVVIDQLIQELVARGADTVINLGAGLDTRPYRLTLPSSLRWVEVDYADIIEHKDQLLANEKPGVKLERVALDLSQIDERRALFAKLSAGSRNCLVLTEGVLPYLTEEQASSLADDLHAEASFRHWIAEYYTPEIYRYFKDPRRMRQMRNAPFQFFPADWLGLFREHGWIADEFRYLSEEGVKLGRPMPLPWWAQIFSRFADPKKAAERIKRMAYVVFANTQPQKLTA